MVVKGHLAGFLTVTDGLTMQTMPVTGEICVNRSICHAAMNGIIWRGASAVAAWFLGDADHSTYWNNGFSLPSLSVEGHENTIMLDRHSVLLSLVAITIAPYKSMKTKLWFGYVNLIDTDFNYWNCFNYRCWRHQSGNSVIICCSDLPKLGLCCQTGKPMNIYNHFDILLTQRSENWWRISWRGFYKPQLAGDGDILNHISKIHFTNCY